MDQKPPAKTTASAQVLVRCWTCNEYNESAQHNCIASLKNHIRLLQIAYGELKEKALDAGITVRAIDL